MRWGGVIHAAPLLLLAGCSAAPSAPVGITEDDRRALDDAGAMLQNDAMAPRAVLANESSPS